MTSEQSPKKRGGARPGSGPKKRTAPADLVVTAKKLDGRSPESVSRAAGIIDAMKRIDPQIILDLQLTGSELNLARNRKRKDDADKAFAKLSSEIQVWARDWFSPSRGLDTRRYLYDKADGKAITTVNHVHDKPIEHTHTHTVTERLRSALEKARARRANAGI